MIIKLFRNQLIFRRIKFSFADKDSDEPGEEIDPNTIQPIDIKSRLRQAYTG